MGFQKCAQHEDNVCCIAYLKLEKDTFFPVSLNFLLGFFLEEGRVLGFYHFV